MKRRSTRRAHWSPRGQSTTLRATATVLSLTCIRELLEVFDAEGVDAAFVYTFARYDLPHRDDPLLDLDRASAGVVKVLDGQGSSDDPHGRRYPDMPWERKAAFHALADWFGR